MESSVLEPLITALAGFLAASSGFWIYLRNRTQDRDTARNANTQLLMGLAQNKILELGMKYIERGWVTKDEYQDLRQYLFEPYTQLGGNGTAERIMHAVERLPFRAEGKLEEIAHLPVRSTDRIDVKVNEEPDGN